MTKEERELRREQREHMKRMEAAAKEAGRGSIDVPFLLLVLLLTGVGLIMLLSASFPSAYYESGDPLYYFKRQAAFATLGLAAMVVIGRINYARFRGVAKIALGISIALLVAVIIPGVGITSHGATRWLGIPGTTMRFQPSEIAKLGVILYFADSISKKKDKMRTLRYGILPYGFILVLIAVLMYFEPHLSGTVLILGIGAALVLPEEGLDGKRLFTEAAALLRDETRLAAMHEASLRLGVRDATERIYETVMALVK